MDGLTEYRKEDERLDEVNEALTLLSKVDGLTLGTDSYLLAAWVRPVGRGRAVELGTGTGIVSLLCAARGRFAHIDALEIQEDFADMARRNATMNGLADRITVHICDLRDMRADTLGYEVDAVFANPPYWRETDGKKSLSDRQAIARHEVHGTVADFCAAAGRLLKHGGQFYCVFCTERLSELMAALRDNRLEPKRMLFVHADERSEPSSVLICAKKGGAVGLRVLPPLMLHESKDRNAKQRPLTERVQRIYETMRIEE